MQDLLTPPLPTLQELLAEYNKAEVLEDYRCDGCGKKGCAEPVPAATAATSSASDDGEAEAAAAESAPLLIRKQLWLCEVQPLRTPSPPLGKPLRIHACKLRSPTCPACSPTCLTCNPTCLARNPTCLARNPTCLARNPTRCSLQPRVVQPAAPLWCRCRTCSCSR